MPGEGSFSRPLHFVQQQGIRRLRKESQLRLLQEGLILTAQLRLLQEGLILTAQLRLLQEGLVLTAQLRLLQEGLILTAAHQSQGSALSIVGHSRGTSPKMSLLCCTGPVSAEVGNGNLSADSCDIRASLLDQFSPDNQADFCLQLRAAENCLTKVVPVFAWMETAFKVQGSVCKGH
ncbi:hypothetical protein Bbelb_400520 [Branchiostoma belcheri]|nr:hypothetical protein Bbelb_400520 [Branchiostoma belcheri]